MENAVRSLTVATLQQLHPFKNLSKEDLKSLLPHGKIRTMEMGDCLQQRDLSRDFIYLLEGKVAMFENFSSQYMLNATDERSSHPVFSEHVSSSDFHIEAIYNSDILFFEKILVDNIINKDIFGEDDSEEMTRDIEANLYYRIQHAIDNNQLELPSLPEIALRVKSAIKKEDITADEIENIIQSDPVIALRIVQIANSPIARGSIKIDNLKEAILRLGLSRTHEIVISLAIRLLFKSESALLKKQMVKLYVHSIEIAAISYAIAEQRLKIDPGKFLLAGLLHDIGTIPILAYLEKDLINIEEEFPTEDILKDTIKKLRPAIGSMIVSHWQLSKETIAVVENTENWQYNSGEQVDMCDVINSAHILHYLKCQQTELIPDINTSSSFKKLFTENKKIIDYSETLNDAEEKINEIKRLLKM